MPRHLLIVDDIKSNREILKNILGDEYSIAEAAHGHEALAIMNRDYKDISAVLLDLGMPVMDGFEVLSYMLGDENLSQLPVIVTTGQTDSDSEERALKLGAKDYITKPYVKAIIKQRIRNTINLRETSAAVNTLIRDRLTGLLNREAFFEKVAGMVASHEPCYYIMAGFDIDGFKVINDQYGTKKGDEVLKQIADTFREGFGEHGGICSRITADNFAVLYPASFAESKEIIEIRNKAGRVEGLATDISFSIGRFVVNNVTMSPSNMYDRATLAKDSIKGRYDKTIAVYSESMREHLLEEQKIVMNMREALEERQFEVWYQPQYNHSTGAMIGAEALVRWRNPEKGLISPGMFIPIFEKNGFIYELDKYVWEEVCRCLRKWRDEGRNPLPVSVNISRYEILRPELTDILCGLLKRYEIPVEMLRLEITESAFAGSEHIIDVVKKFIEYGFTVEIDDFGSGYSSLNTLKSVPAQVVKLDMRFLDGGDNSDRGGNIIESVVRMTKWLGMSIIAEGVETKEQADFLKSIGCSYVQGYLYAKPMPLEAYEAYCKGIGKEEHLLTIETIENLDNNSFWNPKSMDTLIFNSYIGGACIFEYHNGKQELLRVNDKYVKTFGESASSEDVYKYNTTDYMDEKNREILKNNIETAIKTGNESTCETVSKGLYGVDKYIFIRSTVRTIARSGDRYLIYCTVINTTARHEAEQKQIEAAERLSAIMADVESGITASVINDGKIEFLFSNDKYYEILGYTREQYDAEVVSPFDLIHSEDAERVKQASFNAFNSQGTAHLEYRAVRRDKAVIWLRVGISYTRFTGATGGVQLSIITDVSAEKKDEQALRDTTSLLKTLMNDTPGGFCRMRVYPDGSVKPIYINKGLMKLMGMSHAEVMEIYGKDTLAGVHPDDIPIVKEAITSMLEKGEAYSSRYRIIRGDGIYIWLMIFGRTTKNEQGETFLNIYYADATAQVEKEKESRDLLDNLPGGAALYEFDGKNLKAIHLNKRYWELVGRSAVDYDKISVISAIHPDDKRGIFDGLLSAIREGHDAECDVRIICGNGEYRLFHINGRIVRKDDGVYSIYATYMPVSDEAAAIRDMLPVVLHAMMETQTDFSFVKDKNFRYVCCSQAIYESSGCSSEADMVGKTDYDLIDKSLADIYYEADKYVMESGKPLLDREYVLLSKDGREQYTLTSKYPLKDSRGNIIGVYGAGRDITEARAMKSQLELLTNNIPGGIGIYEGKPDEIDKIKLVYFNDGLCRLFGYTRVEYEKIIQKSAFGLMFPEYVPGLVLQIKALINNKTPIDMICRVRTKDGGFKWINLKAVPGEMRGDNMTVNAVLFDVTERQNAIERLRVSEEENRLAICHSNNVVCRFDVATRVLSVSPRTNPKFKVSEKIENVPYGEVECGNISGDTSNKYINFYESIMRGEKNGDIVFKRKSTSGWRWIEAYYSTIFSSDGKPVSAVISYSDITDDFAKDAAFKKWQQSLREKTPGSYSLFRCNINKKIFIDAEEGTLLGLGVTLNDADFDKWMADYAEERVYSEDIQTFCGFLTSDSLLSGFYGGHRNEILEYRENTSAGEYRWIKLTADLVEAPHSSDIEGYLMFENIDREKRSSLETIKRSETDPLTEALNRAAFASGVNNVISKSKQDDCHALMMLDIDGFKQINDVFGHKTGDETLVEIASSLRSVISEKDFLGRLGGDEFVIFLSDVSSDLYVAEKAKQICALTRKAFSVEIEISGSVGIAVSRRDGEDFDSLYKKADMALYHVKGSGKGGYVFYHSNMEGEHLTPEKDENGTGSTIKKKRRMLIVDDSVIDNELLTNMFINDFIIERAKDGNTALIRLRHYGAAISVILLDIMMPGMNGFDVLEKIRSSGELMNIPVIVVSGDEKRDTGLRAIRLGADDFVTKPVDSDVLRIRVSSAISKAENERLRVKNSYLEYQNSEIIRYRTVLERSGTVVIEHDWVSGSFTYSPNITEYLSGRYDERGFWHILLADYIADTHTVQKIQGLVHEIASDTSKTETSLFVMLKTPLGEPHYFKMCIYKINGEFGLAGKIYMTLNDVGADLPKKA